MRVPTDRSSAGTASTRARRRSTSRGTASSCAQPVATSCSRLRGAGHATEERRRPLLLGADEEHLAGVRVGRAGLGVEVVAVVPQHHEPEVVHGREGGGAGADDDPSRSAGHGQEVAVARRRAAVGGQADVVPLPQPVSQGGVDPGDVTPVRDADERAPPGGVRRRHGLGDHRGPVVAGGGRPHRARRSAGGEVAEVGVGVRDLRPGRGRLDRRRLGCALGRDLLRGRVAGRHGEAEHVGPRAGVPPGQGLAQLDDLRRQHRLGAHHAPQRLEGAGVVGVARALDDVAVDVLAGEAHLDPRARDRGLRHRRRDGVVERPVEVGQRDVDEHPRDGVGLGGLPRPLPCAAGWRPPWPWRRRRQHEAPEASRLPGLRGTSCGRFCQRATDSRTWWASPAPGGRPRRQRSPVDRGSLTCQAVHGPTSSARA